MFLIINTFHCLLFFNKLTCDIKTGRLFRPLKGTRIALRPRLSSRNPESILGGSSHCDPFPTKPNENIRENINIAGKVFLTYFQKNLVSKKIIESKILKFLQILDKEMNPMRRASILILRPQIVLSTKKYKVVKAISTNRSLNVPRNIANSDHSRLPRSIENQNFLSNSKAITQFANGPSETTKSVDPTNVSGPKPSEIPPSNMCTLCNSKVITQFACGPSEITKPNVVPTNLCGPKPAQNPPSNLCNPQPKLSSTPPVDCNCKCPAVGIGSSKGGKRGPSLGLKMAGETVAFVGKSILAATAVLLTIRMGIWRGPMHPTKNSIQTVKEDTLSIWDDLLCLRLPGTD